MLNPRDKTVTVHHLVLKFASKSSYVNYCRHNYTKQQHILNTSYVVLCSNVTMLTQEN